MEGHLLYETTASDYDDYYAIRCDSEDIYWNGYTSAPDRESFRDIFVARVSSARFSLPEDRRIYLIKVEDGDSLSPPVPVGFLQLIRRPDGVEIGYTVIQRYAGRGYATRALGEGIRLAKGHSDTVMLRIRDDNIGSQVVARRNGFQPTELYELVDYPTAKEVKLRRYELPEVIEAAPSRPRDACPAERSADTQAPR